MYTDLLFEANNEQRQKRSPGAWRCCTQQVSKLTVPSITDLTQRIYTLGLAKSGTLPLESSERRDYRQLCPKPPSQQTA